MTPSAAPVAATPVVLANAAPAATPSAPASLLPPPSGEADGLMALLLLQSQDRKSTSAHAMTQIGLARERAKNELAAARRALQKAARAERKQRRRRKTGRLFGTIAKVAGAVAAVAVAVVSFGAGTPLAALAVAGVVVSLSASAARETHLFQALGVSDRAANFLTAGLSLAGVAMTGGASIGAAIGGVEAGVAAADGVATAASGVGGASTATAAVYHERAAHHGQVAANRDADAVGARHRADQQQRVLLALIAELEAAEESADRTFSSLASAIDAQSNSVATAGGLTWKG